MEKTPKYKVIISSRAYQMLTNHVRFLAQKNPSAARSVKNEIINAIRSLEQMPERYPFLQVDFIPSNKYHKMFVGKRYLIIYQIKNHTVYVDYILDCREDYCWLLN